MGYNKEKTSKFISLILRHKPEAGNLELDKHGWASVDKLLDATKISMEQLEDIVYTDEKNRYSFNADKTLIRANQGHSIDVDVELLEMAPPDILYHGTATRFLDGIFAEGLKKQSRKYVHLSKDFDTAVKVGKRHGNPIVLKIDALRMWCDGYKFYIANNGVWLTDNIPVDYISK